MDRILIYKIHLHAFHMALKPCLKKPRISFRGRSHEIRPPQM